MAKIKALPARHIINGFKGTLDYYLWMGIPCVRRWPRSPGHVRAPAVMAQWQAFRESSTLWNDLSPAVQQAYNETASGTNLSGRDLFTKSYLSPIYVRLE